MIAFEYAIERGFDRLIVSIATCDLPRAGFPTGRDDNVTQRTAW